MIGDEAALILNLFPQDQASEAMEVFNELMESEVSIIVPHVSDIVGFCLQVGAEDLCFPRLCQFQSLHLLTELLNV